MSMTANLRPPSYGLKETALHKSSSEEPTEKRAALPSQEQDEGVALAVPNRRSLLLAL